MAKRPTTVVEVRRRAARLVERGWCQLSYARDRHGTPVGVNSAEAASWCLLGALDEAVPVPWTKADVARIETAAAQIAGEIGVCVKELDYWNDRPGRTQAQVVQALRGRVT